AQIRGVCLAAVQKILEGIEIDVCPTACNSALGQSQHGPAPGLFVADPARLVPGSDEPVLGLAMVVVAEMSHSGAPEQLSSVKTCRLRGKADVVVGGGI